MRKFRLSLPKAFLLTGVCAAALAIGVVSLSDEPNYFTSVSRLLIVANHDEATGKTIGELLNGPAVPATDAIATEEVKRVYEKRLNRPLWTGSRTATEQAREVLDVLRGAAEHGLDPRPYHVAELQGRDPRTLRDAAAYDLLLTDGVLRYARDMRDGRKAAREVDRDVGIPVNDADLAVALAEAADRGEVAAMLAGLQPQHPEYARLRNAFTRYRQAAAAGAWPEFQAGARLSSDPNSAVMARLRLRLAIDDPQLAGANGTNADVIAALGRYQQRNGLPRDERLNRETVRMLNVPAAERAAQIAANMERWRWLPERLSPNRIVVDTITYTLTAFRADKPGLSSRVVVGAPETRTPILATTARSITLNPPWNVPTSIIKNEIMPRVSRNPNYLATQRMRVLKGSFSNPSSLRIQQSPGPYAALGKIKFEMPNRFDVYLHDTPTKAPFAREARAVSHGCVRVQDIFPLASFALNGDPQSGLDRINGIIAGGKTRSLALREPMSVYMLYWTAVPDENGAIAFRPDIYGRDKRLVAAMGDMTLSAIPPDLGQNPT